MKYHVERSIVINASAEQIQAHIKDFQRWNTWSPWTLADPECVIKVDGMAGQPGHSMSWTSDIIGTGSNTLAEVKSDAMHYDLAFITPMKSKAKTAFHFSPEGSGTKVTWTMDSSVPFFLFFMVDKIKAWIRMDYDRGLRMLKALVEEDEIKATTMTNGVQDFEGLSYVGIKRTASMDDMSKVMSKDFEKLMNEVLGANNKKAKSWVTLYPKMNMKTMEMTYIAAISDEDLDGVEIGSEYVRGSIKSGKVFEVKHHGKYDFLGNAWSMGMMHVRAKKLKQTGIPFEYYWNSPQQVSPEDLKTSIYFPVKGK